MLLLSVCVIGIGIVVGNGIGIVIDICVDTGIGIVNPSVLVHCLLLSVYWLVFIR